MEAKRAETLEAFFASSPKSLRPIMTSLNGDNSWILSFPRPLAERNATGRVYYHIVFEPWLVGPATLLHSWFIWMTLATPPSVPDVQAVEGIARQIEELAAKHLPDFDASLKKKKGEDEYDGFIDAILLSFHYLEHTHGPSLRTFDKRIPVIATKESAAMVKPWNHFLTVHEIHDLSPTATTWNAPDQHPGGFPPWLTHIRLPGQAELNFCSALIWTHTDNGVERHEAIIHSPHGTLLDAGPLDAFLNAEPKTEKLALMHALKESHTLWIKMTYGVGGALPLYRKLGGVRYWVPSHHGELGYGGVFMRLTYTVDTERTLEYGLEEEKRVNGWEEEGERPNLRLVENGGCFVLA